MTDFVRPSLSQAEIERLVALLAAIRNPGALSLEAVDGLFCALIASPALVMPHEYLPVILGGALGDLAGVQEMMALLMRYWNAIAQDFEHETYHVGYRGEPAEDGVPGRAWARGYLRGIGLAREGWSRLLQDEREELVRRIPIAAGEVDPAWPQEPLTEEQSNAMWMDMLEGAARAYRYFKQDRLEHARAAAAHGSQHEPYARAGSKVGRNDPCPCGSGKKYKRCCGAPESGNRTVH